MSQEQVQVVSSRLGFIAALDQSGGSTPKALRLYGIEEDEYSSEEEMFDLVHQMRTRIITSPAFNNEKILGAILFERTMDSEIDGIPTAQYLWEKKGIVPFLKIDKGLADEEDGVQVMNPMPELDALLDKALTAGIYGTKERSVINAANQAGIDRVLDQQFEVAEQVLAKGLVPIVEPEVNINATDKAEAEEIMKAGLLDRLEKVSAPVILKLTLPDVPGLFQELVNHAKVQRVVALSGGYTRQVANEKLAANPGVIASFSRALSEGLSAQQSDEEFNSTLAGSIEGIYQASVK